MQRNRSPVSSRAVSSTDTTGEPNGRSPVSTKNKKRRATSVSGKVKRSRTAGRRSQTRRERNRSNEDDESYEPSTSEDVNNVAQDSNADLAVAPVEREAVVEGQWTPKRVHFDTIAQARKTYRNKQYLNSFFERCRAALRILEGANSTKKLKFQKGWDLLKYKRIPIYIFGESGAGKSTLCKAITGDESFKRSATTIGTVAENSVAMPLGFTFIDTPGFRVPLTTASGLSQQFSWLKEVFIWRKMLYDLRTRITGSDARVHPFAMIYCHRAGTRIIKERILELVRIPHEKMIPVYIVVTDPCSVADEELSQIMKTFKEICLKAKKNAKGSWIRLIQVNSFMKVVRGHKHRLTGVRELMHELLNNLDPFDIVTFARPQKFHEKISSIFR